MSINNFDFNSRHIIEALRSGISSREVGYCFSSARPKIMREIDTAISKAADTGFSGGMFISGKYGEGKTHLLNTVLNMAQERNMVVSLVSLSKETPFDKLHMIYPKIVQGTFLPGRLQPGFRSIFENMTKNSPVAVELSEYCLTGLETNKLYYVLKSYLGTEDGDEKAMLIADLEGDFAPNAAIKNIFKRVYEQKATFNQNFVKSRHTGDYITFMSNLFLKAGYNGWVLLFDEAELIGRMGKKARLNSYKNMFGFIYPEKDMGMKSVYSIFAFNSSFIPDVIESKHEYDNLEQNPISPDIDKSIKTILNDISTSPQLVPLNKDEILAIHEKIQNFHGKAYNWKPDIETAKLYSATEKSGYLLRTRIRAAVELLDQLYQYGKAGNITVNELGQGDYNENMTLLDSLDIMED